MRIRVAQGPREVTAMPGSGSASKVSVRPFAAFGTHKTLPRPISALPMAPAATCVDQRNLGDTGHDLLAPGSRKELGSQNSQRMIAESGQPTSARPKTCGAATLEALPGMRRSSRRTSFSSSPPWARALHCTARRPIPFKLPRIFNCSLACVKLFLCP